MPVALRSGRQRGWWPGRTAGSAGRPGVRREALVRRGELPEVEHVVDVLLFKTCGGHDHKPGTESVVELALERAVVVPMMRRSISAAECRHPGQHPRVHGEDDAAAGVCRT